MAMQRKTLLKPASVLLLAWSAAACESTAPSQTSSPSPAELAERHVAAIRNAQAQEAAHLNALAAAVAAEPRNDAWASPKETELRQTFATEQGLPRDALKSVNCRSSKCDLQLDLRPLPQAARPDQQWAAVNYWIANSQPCGYTMAPAPGAGRLSRAIRIFLDCGK
jgi:hypothetical protein